MRMIPEETSMTKEEELAEKNYQEQAEEVQKKFDDPVAYWKDTDPIEPFLEELQGVSLDWHQQECRCHQEQRHSRRSYQRLIEKYGILCTFRRERERIIVRINTLTSVYSHYHQTGNDA